MSDELKPNHSSTPASEPSIAIKNSEINTPATVKSDELVDSSTGRTNDKGGSKSNPNGVGLIDI